MYKSSIQCYYPRHTVCIIHAVCNVVCDTRKQSQRVYYYCYWLPPSIPRPIVLLLPPADGRRDAPHTPRNATILLLTLGRHRVSKDILVPYFIVLSIAKILLLFPPSIIPPMFCVTCPGSYMCAAATSWSCVLMLLAAADDTPPAILLLFLLPGYTSFTTKWLLLVIHLHLVYFTDVFLYSTAVQTYLLIKYNWDCWLLDTI